MRIAFFNELDSYCEAHNLESIDVINGAGHCPHDEMPEKVNPIIKRIIQDTI